MGFPPEATMASASFFDGIPPDDLSGLLARLPRRTYPAGATVVAEGESLGEICVTESGSAEVYVSDRYGVEHSVGRAGPGTTIGEMSLLTGLPAVGTVRASEPLEVIVLGRADFEHLCERFPQMYRNLGTILSERLARTNRLVAREQRGRLVVVHASPQAAYALACSVAWHARASTVLVLVGEGAAEPLPVAPVDPATLLPGGRATVATADAERVESVAADLCARWEHVLVAGANLPGVRSVSLEREPTIGPADEEGLQAGLLPPSTPAGRHVAAAARRAAGLTVGVALGAGSIRGFAHWGVLDALDELGVPIDYLAGSSVGGSVAAMYALGHRGRSGAELFERGAATLFRPTLPRRSLLSSRALARYLDNVFGDARLEDLEPALAVVTTDLRAQRSVVLRRGLVQKAVLATLSIPGIFPAQRSGPYVLVDGGVLDPVPVGVAADMGADVVIGVRLLSRPTPDEPHAEVQQHSSAPTPSALGTIMRSIEMMQTRLGPDPTNAASIMLTPELGKVPAMKLRNFSAGIRYVEAGAAEARGARPRLAAALPWLRT
jgi:NTE family protein